MLIQRKSRLNEINFFPASLPRRYSASSVTRLGYFCNIKVTNHVTRIAQIYCDFFGYYENVTVSTFWETFDTH